MGSGIRRGDAAVAAAFVVLTVLVVSGAGGDRTSVALADVTAVVAALAGALAATRRSRTAPPETAPGWRLLTIAMVLWGAGEALWTWDEAVRGVEVPFPSIADVAYLGAVPFAAAGLLAFIHGEGRQFRVRAVLDGSLIAGSLLFVGWALALGPTFRVGAEDLLTHVVSVAYPVTDVVLAALALFVVQWGGSSERRSLRLVAAALLVMAVADTAFTWLTTNGTYTSSNPISMLWPASYLLVALAARPSHAAPAHRAAGTQTTASLLLPYVPLLAAVAVAVPRVVEGRPLGPFLTVNGLLLVLIVLVRQALTAWELRDAVHALHDREAELERLALEDPLTGLANRARFAEELEAAVGDPRRHPAVVYIDLDGFKAVNDRFGHAVGDQLLTEAAVRLRACCDSSMLLARLGGDEFVILVEDDAGAPSSVAQRVLHAFAVPFTADGEHISFQASIGVAAAPPDGAPEEAVRRADAAMYVAKQTGKGRAVEYPDGLLLHAP